jgi:hypothetical protein
MKSLRLLLLTGTVFLLLNSGNLRAQNCEYWTVPQPVSDSVTDNRNATLAMISYNPPMYYVFWERSLGNSWSEIVCANYYETAEPTVIFHGNAFDVSNPQVIAVSDYPETDTLAFVFYQYAYMEGYLDIFYRVMTDTGFTGSARFTNTTLNESHLRVSPGGGMVWQEGDKIKFSRLKLDNSGFYFEPVVTIDEGDCRNPDIQNTDLYNSNEEFIAWEKGDPENPEIWYSRWSFENEAWGEPILLFEDGYHSGIKFSIGTDIASWIPILLSDFKNETGQFHISGYDFYEQDEFISEFTQSVQFQPDLLTIDFFTADYWHAGYLSFKHDEGVGNSDIFSSDYAWFEPGFYNYCRIDSTVQADVHPQLFQGAWHFSYFDLVCIWESWRNGHWQIFSSTTPVVIGNVPEREDEGDMKVRAYPNPVTDFLWLECESGGTSSINIAIYNTFGQLVKSCKEEFSIKDKTIKSIGMRDLPSGIYLVRIEAGNAVNSLRIVKK